MLSLNFMFFCSLIKELCTKEENYKTSLTLILDMSSFEATLTYVLKEFTYVCRKSGIDNFYSFTLPKLHKK